MARNDVTNSPSENWLITGGAGFIGVNLLQALLSKGLARQVRIVDDLSSGSAAMVEQFATLRTLDCNSAEPMGNFAGVELAQVSVIDGTAAKILTRGADVVVHLAANTGVQPSIQNPVADATTNVFGILNYLEAARGAGVKSFVFSSSGAPTGRVEPPIHEEVPCKPMSPYGASKLAGEGYCFAYNAAYGLNTVALRFSNVYGKYSGRKGSVVAQFLRRAVAGESWILNGGGAQTRDFIYVEDLVDAIIRAAALGTGGELFQIATARETSVAELASIMSAVLREDHGIEARIEQGAALQGDMPRNFADNSKARRILGWTPRMSVEDGLQETAKWFMENHDRIAPE
jgi:UDP-glucose 4-epimerase